MAADLEHDVLVVPGSAPDTVGPTSLFDPGSPSWTAPLGRVEVSPDGRFLLGRVTGPGDVNALADCGLDGTCTRATAWRRLRL